MEEEVERIWTDDERLAVRRVAFECDLYCYEGLITLYGRCGTRKPVWSDYADLQKAIPGA